MKFRKALRENVVATVALIGIVALGAVVGGYILSNQRLYPPAWVPIVGQEHFNLRAELKSAAGVMPGQGQTVNVSGVKVGDIAGVELENGKAVATLRIKPRFARIYPDASFLLRPKTGLKDMVLELDPGTPASGRKLAEGATIKDSSTLPDGTADEFFASLDKETQDYLGFLVNDAGRALEKGGGHDLANTFRRFDPLARDFRKASALVAKRRVRLKRVMTNFSLVTSELGKYDRELTRFVNGSEGSFRRFANQNENLAETVRLLPPALQASNNALVKLDNLGRSLNTNLAALNPMAKSLAPTLRQLQPFLRRTTPVLRNQIRPFAREAQPTARDLVPAAREFNQSTKSLTELTDVLNNLTNEFAYDPPGKGVGKEPYSFYAPWAAHNTNSVLSTQDGVQPLRRGLIYMNCGTLELLELLANPRRNPTLSTVIQMLNAPERAQVCKPAPGARRP